MMDFKKINWTLISSLLLTLGIGVILGWVANSALIAPATSSASNSKDADLAIFWQAWQEIKKSYYQPEDINDLDLVRGATQGMVAAVGDPYTMYLPPENNERSGEDLAGVFYGIGVELGYIDGVVGVQAPLPDTPAEKAGLMAKDIFIHVKDEKNGVDEDTFDWTVSKAQSILRAKEKSPVIITVFRKDYHNNEPFEVEIVRDEIKVDSVKLSFLNDENNKKIAHIKVSSFGERTYEEWENVVKQVQAESGVSGVVLDLRNNPGGLFSEALHIASEFVVDGVIVKQEGRKAADNRDYKASGRARLDKLPLVVLVNGGSASSSEIVAGALRDRTGAKIVGEKTFGKGLVQERMPLSDGGGLHVTIAKWKLPGGDWIQKEGIAAQVEAIDDYETKDTDEALDIAIKELK